MATPARGAKNGVAADAPEQLTLSELLDAEPDKLHQVPIDPEGIGGELLAILSKGLYNNPLDCIREYVQNSVDAGAQHVTIKLTGNSAAILDSGRGMNLDELLQARQFGLSAKSIAEHVGFRGIGIYSGFDICNRLRITTKRAGDEHIHVLVFQFASMREVLDADRNKSGKEKTSLIRLLSNHTYVKRERSSFPKEKHFTHVELQEINDVHVKQLSNRAEMRRYLLQNLPVDFHPDFPYRKQINDALYARVPSYNAVSITLQSDGIPDETVTKDNIPDLQPPAYDYIVDSTGRQVAYYWACLNAKRGAIDSNYKRAEGQPSFEGFVYKVKGFTIGDRDVLRAAFKQAQLYRWYTGEIYVLDDDVVPNAGRDAFETSPARRSLDLAVRGRLGLLEKAALEFQVNEAAREKVVEAEKDLNVIASEIEANAIEDPLGTWGELNEILRVLANHKKAKARDVKPRLEEATKKAKRLQDVVRKMVDDPRSEAERAKKAAKAGKRTTSDAQRRQAEPAPRLPSALSEIGFETDGDLGAFITIVQNVLEDVLSLDSPAYRSIVSGIVARAAELTGADV
ncbi:MAG TPA: ATP-binding protein [Longimicrobium sp.]|jgi:molecular chaperone HtpG